MGAEAIGRLVRRVNGALETVEQHDLNVRVDTSEPIDALGTLDFAEERQRAGTIADAQADALQAEEAALHDVVSDQRAALEDTSTEERECQRLRARVEQLQRQREEYREWSANVLDDAQRTAEETEDAVHEAQRGNNGPTVRDQAEIDELGLQLKMERERNAEELSRRKGLAKRDLEQVSEDRHAVQQELITYAAEMERMCNSVIQDALRIGAGANVDEDQENGAQRRQRLGGC